VKSNENAVSVKDDKYTPSPTALLLKKFESGSEQATLFVAATRYVYPRHALTAPAFAAGIGV
jgi:hypothetical protein